jgi:hypothetical protein
VPSIAQRELERDPGLVFDIIQMRDYAQAKHAIDTAKDDKDVPKTDMAELVTDIIFEIFTEDRAQGD